ncbi:hypothetical protein BG003_004706 [Podila horticola]|nr:hypothetical protein BG003_004706 [Podila horticola]
MDPSKDHPQKHHPVIDTLHETRHDHHQQPFPNPNPLSGDVTDEVLEEAGAVPLNDKDGFGHRRRSSFSIPTTSNSTHQEGNAKNKALASPPLPTASSPQMLGLSTMATQPSSGWQSLADKSSNQLYTSSSATSQQHELSHDKPSVLPEILPGFKGRMADIHHATVSSVSGSNTVSSSSPSTSSASSLGHEQKGSNVSGVAEEGSSRKSSNGLEGATYWTAGTMFPAMMPGFKSPFAKDEKSQHHQDQQQHQQAQRKEEAHRKLSKSSILYESSNPDDVPEGHLDQHISTPSSSSQHASTATSSTTVQGGQGGRRWSHELSPEKAGLVGSVIEVAGLLKDVVLDKIQQLPPSITTKISSKTHKALSLSEEDKEEAARLAFGGAEETGDQALYLEGLQERYGRIGQEKHRHEGSATATTAATTTTTTSQDLLGSAPTAAHEHHKSVFHLSGNPDSRKSLLLDHPEQLGYHARDPALTTEESPLTLQHRLGSTANDVSKATR